MKIIRLPVTTATGGSGTSEIIGVPGGGVLYAVQCVDGDFADGVDLAVTCEQGELAIPLLTVANFDTDSIYYPRVLEALNTDGTALATHCMPIVTAGVKAAITNGGAVKSGSIILYVLDM